LQGNSSNEAEAPVFVPAEAFNGGRRGKHPGQMDHGFHPFRKMACCSMSPDQSRRSRQPSTAPRL
jgi:hypothetical protein